MFFVYAIKSKVKNYTYVGLTSNLENRLLYHNRGYEKSTRAYKPFDLIYFEEVSTRQAARRREKFLKSGQGRLFLEKFK